MNGFVDMCDSAHMKDVVDTIPAYEQINQSDN